MFERFTDRARKVMALANQEAQRFNHEYIGSEHILLGLVKEGSGVASSVLQRLGVDLATARKAVEELMVPGDTAVTMGKLPQTPMGKLVIQHAISESKKLNHNYVGTEHLLLGLLHEPESMAFRVLTKCGITAKKVREDVMDLLGPMAGDTGDGAAFKVVRPGPTVGGGGDLMPEEMGHCLIFARLPRQPSDRERATLLNIVLAVLSGEATA